ncbi:hypothetical protein [Haladaptatus sp. CMSO5]|uniref:hypothetical protein n=1 Tax=Haladaptatus sp. CMSO5 TaxID=3120514 RepID=UPI002FCE4EC2
MTLLVIALAVFEDAIRSMAGIVHLRDQETESMEEHVPDGPCLVANVVTRVPPDAIVSNAWADPIKDCHPIQYILKEAFLSKQTPKLVLTKQESIQAVKHVFSLLPYTEGDEEDERDGYYVNTNHGVAVLTLEESVTVEQH